MIQFSTDNGYKFSYPNTLEDITLKQYIEFLDFVETTKPKCLLDIEEANNKIQEAIELKDKKGLEIAQNELNASIDVIDDVVKYQQLFPYYARVVSFFSGLDVAIILGTNDGQGMKVEHLEWLYNHITDIFNHLPAIEYSNTIEVNGEKWYLPEQYMTNSTVIEFAEAAQFQSNMSKIENGHWKSIAKVMCVLVRKKDEQYSDKLLKREELFLSWNLLDCWKVAFFLRRQIEILKINTATSTNLLNLMRLELELKSSTMDSVGI